METTDVRTYPEGFVVCEAAKALGQIWNYQGVGPEGRWTPYDGTSPPENWRTK